MRNTRFNIVIAALCILLLFLVCCNMVFGSVKIPFDEVLTILCGNEPSKSTWSIIVMQSRIPMIITAILAGSALSVAGLLLQTLFNNPLADPSILGVSTGASLGVALILLSIGGAAGTLFGSSIAGYVSILLGAFIGAGGVLLILLAFSTIIKSASMLLIIGILVSYITSSAISILNFFSTQEGVHSYVIWGLGSFGGVTLDKTPIFATIIILAIIWSALMIKPLNALLLGTRYAENLGVKIKSVRNQLLIITGILTAVVTAFCGPIGFVGLVVPHISRLLLNTSNHNKLLPATILCGAVVSLICTLISVLPASTGVLPINAITPIIGVPIIIYIILNRRKIQYFN